MTGDEIERAVRLINEELVGHRLSDINQQLLHGIQTKIHRGRHATDLVTLMEEVLKEAASEQLYVDGQINLLNNSVSSSMTNIRSLYELIDHDDLISCLAFAISADGKSILFKTGKISKSLSTAK